MVELNPNLLQLVQAQSGTENIARPTFVTDLTFNGSDGGNDNGNNNGNNGGNTTDPATIILATSTEQFPVNSDFEVEIKLNSGGAKISSYSVKVEFDPAILKVVDADSAITGVQISYTDTVFTSTENSANNTTGSIILRAENASGATIGAAVGKIKFHTLKEGTVQIRVVQAESSMVDDASANTLDSVTGIQVNVGSTVDGSTDIIDKPYVPTGTIKDLPKSDLPFSGLLYLLFGMVLVYFGVLGRRLAKGKSRHY